MKLEHFSHDHPLILLNTAEEQVYDDGVEISCYGCEQSISRQSSYGCNRCLFFLHKSCAELPKEITHPSHPEHPLTLISNPPSNYSKCICDVCRETCNRFVYHCFHCQFDVDLRCASVVNSIQQRIEHKSHKQHQLISLQKPAMFFCDACGTKHEGTSYLCTTCGFWINQKCANSLPNTIKLADHHHPLTLIHSIPFEYYKSLPACSICDKRVFRRNWVYYCSDSECRYFVHVKCATSEAEHSADCKSETEVKDLDPNLMKLNSVDLGITTSNTIKDFKADTKAKVLSPNLITLPVPNESVDLMTQFIKGMREKGKYKRATEIQHVSHGHPLIFFDMEIGGVSRCESKLPLLNAVMKNDEKCNGCAQNISTPFFYCDECNFFLHEWCAELPIELRYPCHPEHPLLLTPNIILGNCRCCRLECNTFIFSCFDCNFFLDCKCASLPRIIRHEAHKHTLALRRRWSGSCLGCNYDLFSRFAFVCDPCNLDVCVGCALLSGTVRHRYDEHPFTLTYSHPLKDQVVDEDEYFCEICLNKLSLNLWFYHCAICDQSLHTRCIRPIDRKSNVKSGKTIKMVDYHPHLLTRVERPKEIGFPESRCGICGLHHGNYGYYDLVMYYECAPCNFWLCPFCARQIPRK